MAYTIQYIKFTEGTKTFAAVTESYNENETPTIYAVSGTLSIVNNDIGGQIKSESFYYNPSASYLFRVTKNNPSSIIYSSSFSISGIQNISQQTNLLTLAANDKIRFELLRTRIDQISTPGDLLKVFRTSIGSASLSETNANTPVITGSNGSFITSILNNEMCLTSSICNLYNTSSIFVPSSSVLFSTFGDVLDNFYINVGDILVTRNSVDGYNIYNISNISTGSGDLCLTVSPSFASETVNNIQYILILKKKEDETNIILNYNKLPGATSYGFIIPNNLHPDVLKNIDLITKEVKTKLLENNTQA